MVHPQAGQRHGIAFNHPKQQFAGVLFVGFASQDGVDEPDVHTQVIGHSLGRPLEVVGLAQDAGAQALQKGALFLGFEGIGFSHESAPKENTNQKSSNILNIRIVIGKNHKP